MLDHIGFEVDSLQAFCARLVAAGVELDVPCHEDESFGAGVAFLTDPWGTYVGSTEGLDEP